MSETLVAPRSDERGTNLPDDMPEETRKWREADPNLRHFEAEVAALQVAQSQKELDIVQDALDLVSGDNPVSTRDRGNHVYMVTTPDGISHRVFLEFGDTDDEKLYRGNDRQQRNAIVGEDLRDAIGDQEQLDKAHNDARLDSLTRLWTNAEFTTYAEMDDVAERLDVNNPVEKAEYRRLGGKQNSIKGELYEFGRDVQQISLVEVPYVGDPRVLAEVSSGDGDFANALKERTSELPKRHNSRYLANTTIGLATENGPTDKIHASDVESISTAVDLFEQVDAQIEKDRAMLQPQIDRIIEQFDDAAVEDMLQKRNAIVAKVEAINHQAEEVAADESLDHQQKNVRIQELQASFEQLEADNAALLDLAKALSRLGVPAVKKLFR